MQCWRLCYGFITCWYATWLVFCPPKKRRRLYLSDPFLAATRSPPPAGGRAATTYGALAWMQRQALSNPGAQQQFVDEHPTRLGPAAAGGGGGGGGGSGDGQDGTDDSGSDEEPDAGAALGSDERYTPTA